MAAFRHAFGALEACFGVAGSDRGNQSDKFSKMTKFLESERCISHAEAHLANFLGRARNLVVHTYGFEPSPKEVERTISRVRSLCSKFAKRVSDIMISPVIEGGLCT